MSNYGQQADLVSTNCGFHESLDTQELASAGIVGGAHHQNHREGLEITKGGGGVAAAASLANGA